MGKRTPSKWLTLMAACFGLLMLYIDLFIVIVPFFSVFSRLLSRVEQPAGWLWLSRWRSSPRLFRLLPRYSVCCPAISSLHLLCSPSGCQALFHSSKRQRHRCCYLNFLACLDGQQREFAF